MRELYTIIPKLPGVRVYLFAEDERNSKELARFCKEMDHYLEIVAFDEEIFEKIKNLEAKTRLIEEEKERYNQRAYHYDTIFIDYAVDKLKDKEQFFKKVYRMTKNAGDIVFEVEEGSLEDYMKLLEDVNFVAINPIKSQNRTYLTAKKLHGWTKV